MLRYAELRARGDSTLTERKEMLVQHADRLAASARAAGALTSASGEPVLTTANSITLQ